MKTKKSVFILLVVLMIVSSLEFIDSPSYAQKERIPQVFKQEKKLTDSLVFTKSSKIESKKSTV